MRSLGRAFAVVAVVLGGADVVGSSAFPQAMARAASGVWAGDDGCRGDQTGEGDGSDRGERDVDDRARIGAAIDRDWLAVGFGHGRDIGRAVAKR